MESSSAWFDFVVGDFNLCPAESLEAECPQVVHICNSLTSEYKQVGEDQLRDVISSLPGSCLILLGSDFDPFFSFPIKNTDRVETLLICTSATENYDLVIFGIVIHRAVRTLSRNVSERFNLTPFHSYRVECPQVVHVGRISITAEKYNVLSNHATAMTPPR